VYGKFKYDARNRRVARFEPSTGRWTYVVSDAAGNPLSEIALVSGAWVPVRDHVWLDGRPLAQIEYPSGGGADRYYHHVDHLGLPRALTNAAGQVVWSATPARPYGDIVETATPDPLTGRTVVTNLRLPGQYDERLLGSLGLQGPYYNWNRWYLPGMGRYLELDPIAVGGGFNGGYGVDWYPYALGHPLRYTDPWGLYGTNDCSYYKRRCAESGGKYYCEQAQYWCEWFGDVFGRPPDPDPFRDDDYEGWARCTRQCLQDCDREENEDQHACPGEPDDRKGPWDLRSKSSKCHVYCYDYCRFWGWGLQDEPPYPPRPSSD
jgi:RHS repeat-associated protein